MPTFLEALSAELAAELVIYHKGLTNDTHTTGVLSVGDSVHFEVFLRNQSRIVTMSDLRGSVEARSAASFPKLVFHVPQLSPGQEALLGQVQAKIVANPNDLGGGWRDTIANVNVRGQGNLSAIPFEDKGI